MNKIKEFSKNIPSNVLIVGVTKYLDKDKTISAVNEGLKNIGENRIDSINKISGLNVKKHFIGDIQSKNIQKIVENFDLIQSVYSLKHLEKIDRVANELKKVQEVLIQLKISKDENKKGVNMGNIEEINSFFNNNFKNVKVLGFMVMATKTDNEKLIKSEFKLAKKVFDKYKVQYSLKYLSIGMSSDYKIAIEEGSNMIRVGTILFK